ncbi:hypothetical protein Dda_5412 [Drechslerella dactyloides]|uniref:Uncharacterized protein n=1 Tax=Drechslerella dactyloides TaxID=74499 RepID=A0AAD6J0A2_DREDA|nr:hypothetical protein Dda_5412 [Drechslerella dactyloides]
MVHHSIGFVIAPPIAKVPAIWIPDPCISRSPATSSIDSSRNRPSPSPSHTYRIELLSRDLESCEASGGGAARGECAWRAGCPCSDVISCSPPSSARFLLLTSRPRLALGVVDGCIIEGRDRAGRAVYHHVGLYIDTPATLHQNIIIVSTTMLEYFTYRKFKAHKDAKDSGAKEVLDHKDEEYFEGLVESPAAQEVPLTASSASSTASTTSTPATSEASAAPKKQTWKETVTDYATETYEKARQSKLAERLPSHLPAFLQKKGTVTDATDKPTAADKGKQKESSPSRKTSPSPDKHKEKEKEKEKQNKDKGKGKMSKAEEAEYYSNLTGEEKELHDALDALSLAAQDGKAFSLSSDTREILQKFTQILKDMINGVPTAYDDLINLFETSSKQLQSTFDDMPGFLKTLTKKIPGALGLSEKALAAGEGAGAGAGLAAQAATLSIPTLRQIVTKPGIVADTLKTVVNAIKLRFPGIALGTNVILSMALFVLLFVFWYCWKRGKEVRLEKERVEREEREAKEAEAAKAVLEAAPAVPTTDPSTSATTTTNTAIDEVILPGTSALSIDATATPTPTSYGTAPTPREQPPTPLPTPQTQTQTPAPPPQPQDVKQEVKPERQIKDLF